MAYVLGEFNLPGQTPEVVGGGTDRFNTMFGMPDVFTGRLIVAECLGDSQGANIYKFEDMGSSQLQAMRKLGSLLLDQNIYQKLLPWERSPGFPMHLDSGEEGTLHVVHRPLIRIALMRGVELSD